MPFDHTPNRNVQRTLLPRRKTLVLDDAAGSIVSVDYGCVWVTLERDPRDIVLLPGMRFEIDREGRTVIAAEEDSRLRVESPQTWAQRVAAALDQLRTEPAPGTAQGPDGQLAKAHRVVDRARVPYY
jgi:DUF2917 family protein